MRNNCNLILLLILAVLSVFLFILFGSNTTTNQDENAIAKTDSTNADISAVSQTAENDDADNKEIPSTSGWGIESIPAFDGGTNSRTVYSAGQGLVDATFPEALNSDMMVISETDTEMFYRYCGKLEEKGIVEGVFNESVAFFSGFFGEAGYVYVYYVSAKKVTNVILDKNSTVSPEQFGYSYDKMPGDTTALYQYGLPQIQEIVPYNENLNFLLQRTERNGLIAECAISFDWQMVQSLL